MADAQHLPQGRHQAGDRHLNFHESRDNLDPRRRVRFAPFMILCDSGPLIALAERLDVREVATLDQRHFRVVRPNHVNALTLLPEAR